MKALLLFFAVSLSAQAAEGFTITGYSPFGYNSAKADAQTRANSWCPHGAVRISQWALRDQPQYMTRCSGRAEDKVCDDYLVKIDQTATANFRCR